MPPPPGPARAPWPKAAASSSSRPASTTADLARRAVTFNLEDAEPDRPRAADSQHHRQALHPPEQDARDQSHRLRADQGHRRRGVPAFLSILELNGMALVPSGRYLKIVESQARRGPRPSRCYTGDESVPAGDRFVTRAAARQQHLRRGRRARCSSASSRRDGNITAYAPTNTMIITDTGTNIRRMLRILEAIDVARTGEQIWIEPVHHANATRARDAADRDLRAGRRQRGAGDGRAAKRRPAAARARASRRRPAARSSARARRIAADQDPRPTSAPTR